METIKNYLDNVFGTLPKTEELLKIKNDLLVNMEEKYRDYKEEGHSENEAVGKVIAEFGDIDEILNELGIKVEAESNMIEVSKNEAQNYLEAKRVSGLKVAIGVFLIIMGVNSMFILGALSNFRFMGNRLASLEAYGIVPFFTMIAIAVALFILSGQDMRRYEYLEEGFFISKSTKAIYKAKEENFLRTHTMAIVIGVVLCILSPLAIIVPNIVGDTLSLVNVLNLPGISLNTTAPGMFIMLSMIAIAVFLFIYYGSIKSGYDLILQQGEYSYVKDKETSRFVNVFTSILWPVVVIIFLLLGFLGGLWHIAWIVFPIAGILQGMITSLYGAVKK